MAPRGRGMKRPKARGGIETNKTITVPEWLISMKRPKARGGIETSDKCDST